MGHVTTSTANCNALRRTRTRSSRKPRNRHIRTAALFTVLVSAALATGVPSANAFSTDLAYGSYGTITVPPVFGSSSGANTVVVDQAGVITQSPRYAGIAQRVCIHHRLFAHNGSTFVANENWSFVDSIVNCGWIAPDQSAIRYPAATFGPRLSVYRTYYTDMTVTWKDRPGGHLLGRLRVNHSDPTDYRCGPGAGCTTLKTHDGLAGIFFDFF